MDHSDEEQLAVAQRTNVNKPQTSLERVMIPTTSSIRLDKAEIKEHLEADVDKMQPIRFEPSQLLSEHRNKLTCLEVMELMSTSSVYYLGEKAIRVNCHDDSRGFYPDIPHDHIKFRFEILREIKRGAYGAVVNAYDHKRLQNVAIKIFRYGPQMDAMAIHECSMLKYSQSVSGLGCEFIVRFFESFSFRFHSCLTFELLGNDLAIFIKNNKMGVEVNIIKTITHSVLQGLAFLHNSGIIHADLKPNNIAVIPDQGYKCKILDLGLAMYSHKIRKYDRVQILPYRAPEVILKVQYSYTIDIFSLGIITFELAKGWKVFYNSDEVHLMSNYVRVLGLPPNHVLNATPVFDKFFKTSHTGVSLKNIPGSKYLPRSKPLKTYLFTHDQLLLQFIEDCLTMDSILRQSASMLLRHPWYIINDTKVL